MSGRIIVLACGDELRGDDGVALAAVGALPPAVLAHAEVRIVGAVAVEDLVALPVGSRVVIVDAVAGPAPGQLVELELAALHGRASDLAAPGVPAVSPTSSHQLPLPEVVALAGLLRDAPLEGRFVGVGIGSVAFGSGLSEPVAAAVPALTEAVARIVRALG
jgi:hydrogenase maturation protease